MTDESYYSAPSCTHSPAVLWEHCHHDAQGLVFGIHHHSSGAYPLWSAHSLVDIHEHDSFHAGCSYLFGDEFACVSIELLVRASIFRQVSEGTTNDKG